MAFEITGKLIEKYDTTRISEKFQKREFVVEKREVNAGNEFVDYIKFQLTQDRCGLIEPFQLNDIIRIRFDIRGNRWEKEGKVSYFTNLSAFRIEKAEPAPDEDIPGPALDDMPPEDNPEEDDLPF
ncbi:MAG TPA: DUF3127 domain-containing protein [Bacteroidetes bacterium]|nr:DUF3127 domain-containing protein [Bacteroidota bacterium]